MQQHSLTTGRRAFQLLPPIANELSHVVLCALEFLNLLPKGPEFFFGKVEHMMAGRATVIACTQDFGKLFQRKAKSQSSLHKLNSLDGRCWEDPVTATRALRGGQKAEALVVA